MPLRIISWLFIGLLSAALASACATRFQPPQGAEPHATLALPALGTPTAGMVVEPVAINGLPRPQYWTDEGIRVPPGELRLSVRAAAENLHGTCSLSFAALEGERYHLDARSGDDAFTIRASRDGRVLSECVAAKTLSPTPLRVPGVIPAR